MKKNVKRLSFAAILSLACFGATSYWYHHTNSANSANAGKKPIAYVDRTKDEIHRRPVTRIIWQLINDGDPVFPGEAIRTSSLGEVRIQFADSSRFIDLEPDSLIVITQSANKEISLDLMDGGLMVNQGAAAGQTTAAQDPGLKLKNGGTSVDLSHATASLSKSGSKIDLQVLKGKAKIDAANGQSKELESGKSGALGSDGIKFDSAQLQILAPSLDKPFSQDPENPHEIAFAWKGFPAKSSVTLEVGKTRKELKAVSESKEEKISVKLPSGKHFWKLVARDPQTQKVVGESSVYRLEVANRFPPVLLSPGANERILKTRGDQAVEFKWTHPDQAKSILLEVAQDELLKNKVITEHFENEESLSKVLPDGNYYVRMSASFGEEQKYFTGKIQKFHIGSKIVEPVKIEWLKEAEEKILLPFSGLAAAPIQWNSKQKDQVKIWRVKLAETENELSRKETKSYETKDLNYNLNFKKPGRYIAMVEAVDETNTVLASSSPKTIEIELPPLLEAPHFLPETGDLKADSQGNLNLQWKPIDGAKEYVLAMIRPNSKEAKSAKVTKTSTSLVNLLPGQFQVEITAIDNYGRLGAKETRTVLVPDTSGLATPKVKKIKVK